MKMHTAGKFSTDSLLSARPVWGDGLPSRNTAIILAAKLPEGAKCCSLATSCFWSMTYNDVFLAAGPARSGHGFGRPDTFRLPEAAGRLELHLIYHGVESYCWIVKEPYVRCAVEDAHGRLLAITGNHGFEAFFNATRVRSTPRYAYQRGFVERYNTALARQPLQLQPRAGEPLIVRRSARPDFEKIVPAKDQRGVVHSCRREPFPQLWYLGNPYFYGYEGHEACRELPDELYYTRAADLQSCPEDDDGHLEAGQILRYRFAREYTGHLGLEVYAPAPVEIIVLWDELLVDSEIQWWRVESCQFAVWRLSGGHHSLHTIEPYSMQHAEVRCLWGQCEIREFVLHRHEIPVYDQISVPEAEGPLGRVARAGLDTLAQNAVDIFMDCPSRERAGWVGDAFLTARAVYALTGDLSLETDYLENFIWAPSPGARNYSVPMCYPADHLDKNYIPQNNCWFILQLADYLNRGGDRQLVEAFRVKTEAIINFLMGFWREPPGGLVDLDGWKFMEWSKVSDLQGGLNFPTNFLFARTLSAAGQLYGIPKYTIQAKELAQRMSSLSWDGEVFRDQALETDDGFQPNHEATCYGQYLARLCGVPGATGDNAWWQELVQGGIYGKKAFSGRLHPPNMLFGVLFRWHSLVRAGLLDQFKEEAVEMCDQMAKITGTLWEHTDIRASCNHGCIGYVAAMILHPEKIVDLPG